jgi:hypothetical protein
MRHLPSGDMSTTLRKLRAKLDEIEFQLCCDHSLTERVKLAGMRSHCLKYIAEIILKTNKPTQ